MVTLSRCGVVVAVLLVGCGGAPPGPLFEGQPDRPIPAPFFAAPSSPVDGSRPPTDAGSLGDVISQRDVVVPSTGLDAASVPTDDVINDLASDAQPTSNDGGTGTTDAGSDATDVVDASPVTIADCHGTVSDSNHGIMPTQWSYMATDNAVCAQVDDQPASCIACSLIATLDKPQCSIMLTGPSQAGSQPTWVLSYDPATTVVYVSEYLNAFEATWTPTCR